MNWFDAANWGGAVPDLANVANVVIPNGVNVSFNNATAVLPVQAGTVLVDSIGTGGALTIAAGTLNAAKRLDLLSLTQTGGRLEGQGSVAVDIFNQTDGTLVTQGDFAVAKSTSQSAPGTVAVGGAIHMTQQTGDMNVVSLSGTTIDLRAITGAVNIANISANGALSIDAHSGVVQASDGVISVNGLTTLKSTTGDVVLVDMRNNFKNQVIVNGKELNPRTSLLTGAPVSFVTLVPSAAIQSSIKPPPAPVDFSGALAAVVSVPNSTKAGGLQLSLANGDSLFDVQVSGITVKINASSVTAFFVADSAVKSDAVPAIISVVKIDSNGRAALDQSVAVSESPGNTTVGKTDDTIDSGTADVLVPPAVAGRQVDFSIVDGRGRNPGFVVELAGKGLRIEAKTALGSQLLETQRDVIISVALAMVRKTFDVSTLSFSTLYLQAAKTSEL